MIDQKSSNEDAPSGPSSGPIPPPLPPPPPPLPPGLQYTTERFHDPLPPDHEILKG